MILVSYYQIMESTTQTSDNAQNQGKCEGRSKFRFLEYGFIFTISFHLVVVTLLIETIVIFKQAFQHIKKVVTSNSLCYPVVVSAATLITLASAWCLWSGLPQLSSGDTQLH